MNNALVSVIVTTKNNHQTLEACLATIAVQTYAPIELIIVDNHSTDDTVEIAKRFTPHVFTKGPERSVQRNFAVTKATGEFVLIIDSDMQLDPGVVAACVANMTDQEVQAVIIPEISFGQGFWAECKRLERSFYHGNDSIEAARFFRKAAYQDLGGYDETMVSGEDWDLSQRIRQMGTIARIEAKIHHNEGHLRLGRTLQKKYYYAQKAKAYIAKNVSGSKLTNASGPLQRYVMFLSKPGKLLQKPHVGIGMLFMKTCEFGAGALGYYTAKGDTYDNR